MTQATQTSRPTGNDYINEELSRQQQDDGYISPIESRRDMGSSTRVTMSCPGVSSQSGTFTDTSYSYAEQDTRKPVVPRSDLQVDVYEPPPYSALPNRPPQYGGVASDNIYAQMDDLSTTYEGPYEHRYEEVSSRLQNAHNPQPTAAPAGQPQIGQATDQQPISGPIILPPNAVIMLNGSQIQQQDPIQSCLVWSIVSLFLFLPLGIPAVILSVLIIRRANDMERSGAKSMSHAVIGLNIASTVLFGIVAVFIILPISLIAAFCAGCLSCGRSRV